MASTAILVAKKDAARMLGISLRSIEKLLAARELPIRRIGRRVLIPRHALEQYARQGQNMMGSGGFTGADKVMAS